MSDSDRHGYITFGWVVTIILALFGAAIYHSQFTDIQKSSEYGAKCAEQYQNLTDSTAGVEALPSQEKAENSHGQNEWQPNWCDLAAQQSVAESARGAHWAAWATMTFTGWGAFLIWRTLLATQQAVAETRRLGEAQTRAYMSEERTDFKWANPASGGFSILHTWQNTGHSPALKCTAYVDHLIANFDAPEEFIASFAEKPVSEKVGTSCVSGGRIVPEGQFINKETVERLYLKQTKLIIYSAVSYCDVFDDRHLAESCHVAVFPDDDDANKIKFRVYGHHNGYQIS